MNILEELKLSKKQNSDERYDYLCQQLNVVDYAIKLEKYTIKLQKENKRLKMMNKETNEDARTKQNLLYECSSLNSRLSDEIVKNEQLKKVIDKAINLIVKETKSMPTNGCKIRLIKLLEILNEVSE